MRRREVLGGGLALGALWFLPLSRAVAEGEATRLFHDVELPREALERIERSASEWREVLPEDAWRILFRDKTEPAFSSPLDNEERDGTFVCAACHLPLASSAAKYDSGTGWPSFYRMIDAHVDTKADYKLLIPRTEYHCVRCGGHQGHVFEDGPEPTGERWCNNGLALRFVPADEPLPELRG